MPGQQDGVQEIPHQRRAYRFGDEQHQNVGANPEDQGDNNDGAEDSCRRFLQTQLFPKSKMCKPCWCWSTNPCCRSSRSDISAGGKKQLEWVMVRRDNAEEQPEGYAWTTQQITGGNTYAED